MINRMMEMNKKRDLSDKSNDGDEQKKAKERNLDLSLNQDDADVFSEGIDSPRCASILYDCLNGRIRCEIFLSEYFMKY